MTIKEIEVRTGLPRASVRYYEAQGLIRPGRGENGYRDYSAEDLSVLLKIKLLRQLDCTLEDIRALQAGERPLDAVLQARLEELKRRHIQTDQTRLLCEKLREDRADWAGLEPERYLDWTPAPPPEEAADIRFRIPWRRFFARMLDYTLCVLLWDLVLGAGFRVNILQQSNWDKLVETAAALGLTLLLEPVFLHFLGATPGKGLMGLRLTRTDGSFFSLREGFARTWRAVLMGMGLMIPLVAQGALVLGYLRCRWGREQPWALEDEAWSDGTDGRSSFWETRGSGKRAAAYVGVHILVAALLLLAQWVAFLPWHRGGLTAEEFASNYNHLNTVASAPDFPGRRLLADGTWESTDPNAFVLEVFGPSAADFQLRTQDGRVVEAAFSRDDREQGAPRSLPLDQAALALYAIQGRGMFLDKSETARIARELIQAAPGQYAWELGAWTVRWTLDCRGYHLADGLLLPEEGQTQYLRYEFSIEQTKGGN